MQPVRSVLLVVLVCGVMLAPCAFPDAADRERMVVEQLANRGIKDAQVLDAMRKVPRERFVPVALRPMAYQDTALPIGEGQTISQPLIVAMMTEAAQVSRGARVLEVGTGSGYQAAVLGEMGAEVYTIEILPALASGAAKALAELGYTGVHVRAGDGYLGWPDKAPFDAILVTCAPEDVPRPLTGQVKVGGRIVIPLGPQGGLQRLVVLTRTPTGMDERTVEMVQFVPMVRASPEAPATAVR